MLPITEIEDGLLALPEYKGMIRASENLRQMALYCAALYSAKYLNLLSYSKYPADFVKTVCDKLADNDVVVEGKATESFVRIRVKGAGRLIDQILGKASASQETPAVSQPNVPEMIKASALKKAKEKTKGKKEPGRNVAALMREGIWAAAKQANGTGFTWNDVQSYLQGKGHKDIGDCKMNYANEVKLLVRKGELVCLETGRGSTNPKPSVYALPSKVKTAESKPAPVVPPPSAPLVITALPSPIVTKSALLAGPETNRTANHFIDTLVYLKNNRLADAEAIARTIAIVEREAVI